MDAIAHVLLWFRPGGDTGRRQITWSPSTDLVDQLIKEIRSADPALPITKISTRRQHAMAILKDKLGDLVGHRHPYDEWREKEPPIRIDPVPLRAKSNHK